MGVFVWLIFGACLPTFSVGQDKCPGFQWISNTNIMEFLRCNILPSLDNTGEINDLWVCRGRRLLGTTVDAVEPGRFFVEDGIGHCHTEDVTYIDHDTFEVMFAPKNQFEWFGMDRWTWTPDNPIPDGALQVGFAERGNYMVYVCRAIIGGGWRVGKYVVGVNDGQDACHIYHDGKSYGPKPAGFEILIH